MKIDLNKRDTRRWERIVDDLTAALAAMHEFASERADAMDAYRDERSERWRESETGTEFDGRAEMWRSIQGDTGDTSMVSAEIEYVA